VLAELTSVGLDKGCPAGRDNLDVDPHESIGHQRLRTPRRHKVHVAESSMSTYPKASWPWVKTLLHLAYDQPDAESVAAQHDEGLNALSEKLPKVTGHLEGNRVDFLASTVSRRKPGVWSRHQSFCVR